MLTRLRVEGYKSLREVDVKFEPLTALFGPNAAGKSNILDALQLLSRLATSRTLKEAFEPPYRGKPLESFSFGPGGLKELVAKDHLHFTIEADLELSDGVVEKVEKEIRDMRQPSRIASSNGGTRSPARVRERFLRYRLKIEMLPRSGILRVADEYLAALDAAGTPKKNRRPFLEQQEGKLRLRLEQQAHPRYYERHLDHTILSMPHYPPHYPHVAAARRELESWLFFYFEPRERMRTANPVKEVRHIGLMGENLASFLNTLKATDVRQFEGVEKALRLLIPNIDGIDVDVNELGEVELRIRENGVSFPARVVSEGTLRLLGLLALAGAEDDPSLVGFEEPENGVHPRRIELIAEFLKTRQLMGKTQYIVTTHSPILPDMLPDESLFAVRRGERSTRVDPSVAWGPLGHLNRSEDIKRALSDDEQALPVSDRIMRGDFDA